MACGSSWFRSGISLALVGAIAATVACGDDAPITAGRRGNGGSSGAAGSGGSTNAGAGGGVLGGNAGTGVAGSGVAGSGGVSGSGGGAGIGTGGTDMGGEGGQGGDGLGGEGGESGTGMSGMGGMSGAGGTGGAGAGAGGAGTGGTGAGTGGAGAGAGGAGAGGAGAGGAGTGGAGAGGAGAGGAGAGGAGAGGAGAGGTGGGAQMAPNLYFSEYVEGQMFADAFEVYNANGGSVDLSGCEVRVHYGAAAGSTSVTLTGTLAAGGVYVLCLQRISTACTASAPGFMDLSGDDSVELACMVGGQSVTLDVIGQYGPGLDPGMEWGNNPGTQNQTLRRRCSVTTGDRNPTDAFVPNTQWMGYAVDTVNGLGARTCPCPAMDRTCP